jgi:hypothetical protein
MSSSGAKHMKTIAIGLCILLASIVLPCLRGAEGGSEGADAVAKIIRDWEHRRQSIRSIEYQLEGQGIIPKGRWTGDDALPPSVKGPVPAQDYSYDISRKTILDFENGFAKTDERNETFYFSLVKFVPSERIQVYDGERYVVHNPRETNTGAGHTPSAKQPDLWEAPNINFFFSGKDSPVFLLSGRFRDGGWDVRKLDAAASLKSFTFAGKGKQSGRECVILRLTSAVRPADHQEYWFDTGSGSALLRWIQSFGGNVVYDIHFSYTSGGSEAWPQSWEIAYYHSPQHLVQQERMRVKSLQLNKHYQREFFQMERASGMVVSTREGFFRVNEDKSLTEVPLTEGAPSPPRAGWRVSMYVAVALLVVYLAIVVGRKYLWSKRPTKSPSP